MHKLKLNSLFPIPPELDFYQSYKSAACTKAGNAYSENIKRLYVMAMNPGWTFYEGELWGMCLSRAMHKLGINNRDDPAVTKLTNDYFVKYDTRRIEPDALKQIFHEAIRNAETVFSYSGRDTSHEGLHGLLKVLVIQAWMAFEVLCHDLFRDIEKERPWLTRHLSKTKRKELGFRSRHKIRQSYRLVFTRGAAIDSILNDRSIDALAVMRNVLVHSAGKTDDTFKKESRYIRKLRSFRALPVGSQVKLDGLFVRSLVAPTVAVADRLVVATNRWLLKNP
jgi:hypothetical protein